MFKNVASQKLIVYAYDTSNSVPLSGVANELRCWISKDGAAPAQSNDFHPSEISADKSTGMYAFDLTQAETNCDLFVANVQSSGSNTEVDPVVIYTSPANFSDMAITAGGAVTVNNPDNFKHNTDYPKFTFVMVDDTDHVTPKAAVPITSTRSIDGGAFAACATSASEISNGVYSIDLSASDLNGQNVIFRFTGTNADDRLISVKTTI